MLTTNLLKDLPSAIKDEVFEDIVKGDAVRIERIVSQGQCSPDEHWYDQEQNEWVLILEGHAKLILQLNQSNANHSNNSEQIVELKAGDHINIKAHQKHKVLWTCPNQTTVWLAVFY